MKLLIVEDEDILMRVLQKKFESKGIQVKGVGDGAHAVEAVKAFKPDIILLDIVLPNKDGFEILTEVKADPKIKNIPVIIMSNIVEDEKLKKALKLGAVDYIMKMQHPIDEIVDMVKKYTLQAK